MIRRIIFRTSPSERFRYRGKEILRVEALSDAVFAFSVSLLVVSLEVPQTFDELRLILFGALPFFATISLIFVFWYQQYLFFRRYGIENAVIIFLNLVYLAITLFYVYPLKFLFSLLFMTFTQWNLFPHAVEQKQVIISQEDFPRLIILFSIGYAIMWLLIGIMHSIVKRKKKELDLNQAEIAVTQKEIRGAWLNMGVAIAAILFALLSWVIAAGVCYLFIPIVLWLNHRYFLRQSSPIRLRIS